MRGWILILVLGIMGGTGCDKNPFTTDTRCGGTDFSYKSGNAIAYIPGVFSPNADGINDTYQAVTAGIDECDMKIYNRYGQMLYHSVSSDKGWDGTYKGRKSPGGVYYAVFEFTHGGVKANRSVAFNLFSGSCVPAGLRVCQFPDQADSTGEQTLSTREVFCRE